MLFQESETQNLLPQDGVVHYWPQSISPGQAEQFMQMLMDTVHWQHDEARIYGKRIITRRQYAWYADKYYEYTYSGVTRSSRPWATELLELKALVEQVTGKQYDSCLLNFYPDGESGMAWHRDDESDLLHHGSIASLSFGATRKFSLKHICHGNKLDIMLGQGDLLEMAGEIQDHWRHCIPKTKRVNEPRINLTFRQMLG